MIRLFLLLLFLPGCAILPQAVLNQMDRERWEVQMHRGDISPHDYTDLLLTQNEMEETRHITSSQKGK